MLGPLTSLIAAWQSAAALRILAGAPVAAQITRADVWTGEIRQTRAASRDPECVCCAQRRFEYLEGKKRRPVSLCGRNAVQIHERAGGVDLEALEKALSPLGPVRRNEFALRFFPEPYELTIFPDGRAIIKGTQDVAVARGLYARYLGA